MPDDRGPDAGEVAACRQRLTATPVEVKEIAERGGPDSSSVAAEALQALSSELGRGGLVARSLPGSLVAAAVATLNDWTVGS